MNKREDILSMSRIRDVEEGSLSAKRGRPAIGKSPKKEDLLRLYVTKQRLSWNAEHKNTFNELFSDNDKDKKREYTVASLGKTHHFEVLYHQAPLVDATTFYGFKKNRSAIKRVIKSSQDMINGIIERERLQLKPFHFLPK